MTAFLCKNESYVESEQAKKALKIVRYIRNKLVKKYEVCIPRPKRLGGFHGKLLAIQETISQCYS